MLLSQLPAGADAVDPWAIPGAVRVPNRCLIKGSCAATLLSPEESCVDLLLSLPRAFHMGSFLQSCCQLGNNEVTRGSGTEGG